MKVNRWKVLNICILLAAAVFGVSLRGFDVPPDPNEVTLMAVR